MLEDGDAERHGAGDGAGGRLHGLGWERLLEPCKLLRTTRVDGQAGVYAVYAGEALAGKGGGVSPEAREEMLRMLRERC